MAMKEEMDEVPAALLMHFCSREARLASQLVTLSQLGQPCDITFFERPPMIDVKIDQQIGVAMLYGADVGELAELLNAIKLTNGAIIRVSDIWTINPMPMGGISEDALAAVDLSEADEPSGPNGKTLRQMIRETYHCEDRQAEDRFLRRFIAS